MGKVMQIRSVKTTSQFSKDIEEIVKEKRCEYLDAILLYIDNNSLEVETVASLVKNSSVIKAKLAAECADLRLIKGGATAKLPI
jgi:hypothetical protein